MDKVKHSSISPHLIQTCRRIYKGNLVSEKKLNNYKCWIIINLPGKGISNSKEIEKRLADSTRFVNIANLLVINAQCRWWFLQKELHNSVPVVMNIYSTKMGK